MKRLSRLTALLLAMLMFVSVFAFADGVKQEDLDLETWNELTGGDGDTTTGTSSAPVITTGGEVYTNNTETGETTEAPLYDSEYAVNVAMNAAGAEGETAVSLSQYGKVDLSVAASGCQWQVNIAGQWIDVSGETGSTFSATYAKLQSVFMLNNQGAAQVRCVAADGTVSDVVTIQLDAYAAVAIPETDDELAYSVAPASSTYSLRSANEGIALAAETNETPSTDNVDVIINYVYAGNDVYSAGTAVASPYKASIAKGSSLTTSVMALPVIQGYAASSISGVDKNGIEISAENYTFNDQIGDGEGTIQLNLSNVETAVTFTVKYNAIPVDIVFNHYIQNAADDEYTLYDTVETTAIADTVIGAERYDTTLAAEGSGFHPLWYDANTLVGAKGDTIINIYYDRNYYLMKFELSEGYGVEPIYARYGASITDIGEPKKAGYVFEGWSIDGVTEVELPSTMPAENRTYIALWKEEDTVKVTVVFWGENANDEKYSYLHSSEINVKPDTSFTFSEDGSLICALEEHTHSEACVYACGKEEHTHVVGSTCYQLDCNETSHNHVSDGCELKCTHEHTVDCYSANRGTLREYEPDQTISTNGNGVYTYTTTSNYYPSRTETHYYLYIDGTWYCAANQGVFGGWQKYDTVSITLNCSHSHTDSCYSCGEVESTHVHTVENGCYTLVCTDEEHTHSDECGYECGKAAHAHDSSCYMGGAGLDSNLWTFVYSETVTVAADGSSVVNVYYDRTTFTLTFHYGYSNGSYRSTGTITDKWGADIGTRFLAMNTTASGNLWSTSTSGNSPWTSYLQIMPQADEDYYCRYSSTNAQPAEYYTETLTAGEYELEYTVTAYYSNNLTISKEDFYEMEGFTYSHGTDGDGDSMPSPGKYGDFEGAKFYYSRNSYSLVFNDGFEDVRTESVKYEASLATYETYEPSVPDAYEEGSVAFAGWYLNPECSGEEYDLSSHTMPASNLILYAKWVPTTHTVNVYLTEEDMLAGKKLCETQEIPHRKYAVEPEADNGEYTFVSWFYKETDENGNVVEKAFVFEDMQIYKDFEIYGKWSSTEPVDFTVKYIWVNDEGKEVEIAKPTTGEALDDTTLTFAPKVAEELYTDYQEGYFPQTGSASMTIDIEGTNVLTFYYTKVDTMPYTVEYIEADENWDIKYKEDGVTPNYLLPTEAKETAYAVVTENFVNIPGYVPNEYQIRLVVSADASQNVIQFLYKRDTQNATYTVTHYIENQDGTYSVYVPTSSYPEKIGATCTVATLTITGYEFDHADVTYHHVGSEDTSATIKAPAAVTGVLPDGGMDFELYYNLKKYPYTVRYLNAEENEEGEYEELAPEVKVEGKVYQSTVTEQAIEIAGYTPNMDEITISIYVDNEEGEPENLIVFYYNENEVDITYKVVGPTGSGTVDLNDNEVNKVTEASETVKVLSGTAVGATAAVTSNTYKFEGWYLDEACTQPVDASWITDGNKIVPPKTKAPVITGEGEDAVTTFTQYGEATYYAKFSYNLTTLTITKAGSEVKSNESFIFLVETENLGDIYVSITGTGSKTIDGLIIGDEVTVTEITNWSNRYGTTTCDREFPIELVYGGNNVTFTNSNRNDKWLHDESAEVNVFTTTTSSESTGE